MENKQLVGSDFASYIHAMAELKWILAVGCLLAAVACTPEQREQWTNMDLLKTKDAGEDEAGLIEASPRVADNLPDDGGDPVWLPTPQSIAVYPSTRFAMVEGNLALEARIELRDEMGDPVKAPGRFDITLEGPQRAGMTPMDRTLYRWQVDVRTLADQRRHYDPVTQTYLFTLKLNELAIPRQTMLVKASFEKRDGRVLKGELAIAE